MIGDKVRATYKFGTDDAEPRKSGSKRLTQNVEGTVIFDGDSFLTVQTKNYPTSINKADILTGEVELR